MSLCIYSLDLYVARANKLLLLETVQRVHVNIGGAGLNKRVLHRV